ncbi:MAG: dihydroorotase [Chloroflexota bacterium]
MADLLAVRGGHVIDPASGFDGPGDVLLRGDVVEAILPGHDHAIAEGTRILAAGGLVVAPGFVDLHCHLRVPGQEHKETIATGTAAAARGGFTTICCMPNTRPPLDSPETVEALRERLAADALVDVRIIAAITRGQEGHDLVAMAALARSGVVAFSDDGKPVWNPAVLTRALREAAHLGLPLTLHEEDPQLAGRGAMHAGTTALTLGIAGIPAGAEESMIARDLALLSTLADRDALPGLRMHIAHVTTAGAVELIRRAREQGLPVTAEATPHHLTLTDDLAARPRRGRPYDTDTKVNPPLRAAADVAAVREGLSRGILDVIATDHAPHAVGDKDCAYDAAAFGISNFETALASSLSLVHAGVLSLSDLIAALATRPAAVFRLSSGARPLGRLTPGSRADLVAFAPDEEWRVDAATFASRGHNTPLDGETVRGKVYLTISSGRIAYDRGTLPLRPQG